MKNKGFTLTELLGVLVILSLVAVITIPAITNSLNDYKTRLCNTQVEQIVGAARTWAADGNNIFTLPDDDGETYTVSLRTLQESGFIGDEIENPVTKELFDPDTTTVTITRTGKKYNYEIDDATALSCE